MKISLRTMLVWAFVITGFGVGSVLIFVTDSNEPQLSTPEPTSTPLLAAELVSHRAAYQIVLGQARDGSPVNSASGQIGYGVEKVCGGWLSHQSGTMNLHLTTGDVAEQTMHYSVWEADNGEAFAST